MNNIKLMLVLLASLILGACSSSDDDDNGGGNTDYTETTVSEAPVWQIDWSFNQERPTWTEPDASLYENWTILKVQIEKALQPYVSAGDLLAVFVNGEMRGLASPAVLEDETLTDKFLLKVYGNETGTETVNMSIQYYSQTLKQIFNLSDDINLDSDETTGIDEDFIPEFTYGSAKYPIVKIFNAASILAKAEIHPASGDILAVFVGSECRGVSTPDASNLSLTVFGREEGESLTVKYYQAATNKVFTFDNAGKIKK